MSDTLTFARDFIDRMANPAHGAAINEEYALRFASLIKDEDFGARLSRELQSTDDPDCLTSFGWLWALEWARANELKLSDALLLHLYQTWASVFVRTMIVDLATQGEQFAGVPEDLREVTNPFLAKLLSEVTMPRSELTRGHPGRDFDIGSVEDSDSMGLAEDALIALLQVDRPTTVAAASTLLRREWDGAVRVIDCFWLMIDRQDDETAKDWVGRVNPPRRLR